MSIVCNFSKPTADQPSLLNFDEVSTLFHEFGHALHSLLSQVEYRSLAGTNVYLDFVELPSQIFENWAEEEESLKLFAHHWKTGELLPMNLFQALKNSQKFIVGYSAMRQINFATLDMAWYTHPPQAGESVAAFEERATKETMLLPRVAGTNISAGLRIFLVADTLRATTVTNGQRPWTRTPLSFSKSEVSSTETPRPNSKNLFYLRGAATTRCGSTKNFVTLSGSGGFAPPGWAA